MALYQYITGHSNFEGRAHATFVNPNSFSGYLLLTMPLLIGLSIAAGKKRHAALFSGMTVLSFSALLATGTGGRWIALVAAIVVAMVLFWFFAPHYRRRLAALAALFFIVLLLFYIPTGPSRDMFAPEPRELSGVTMDRLNIWKSTWEVIKERPVRGVGFWSFHTIYSKYKNQIYRDIEHYFSHNDYLQLWAELGLIGVGVFLILIYFYFREGIRCLKKLSLRGVAEASSPSQHIMLLSTLIGSFLLLVHTIGDFDLYIPAIIFIFWGYISYAAAVAKELGLYKEKTIDLASYRLFLVIGKKKLYIITAGIFAFACIWVSDPYLAGLYNERGKGYLGRGEYEKAVKYFSKAVRLDPIDDSYHFNYGLALAKSSSDPAVLAHAEEEMKAAMAIAPYRSDIYFNLANFYREFYLKEKGDVAVDLMKKAIELDPLDSTSLHNLGVLYLLMERYDDAIKKFAEYLEDKPDDIDARIELSEAYRLKKEFDKAEREIEWLLRKNDENNYAHFLMGRILRERGYYERSYNAYKLALREKGKEEDVWFEIGELFAAQIGSSSAPAGRKEYLKRAEEAYRTAMDYNRENIRVINALGRLYLMMDEEVMARAQFERSLELDPGQTDIKALLDRR